MKTRVKVNESSLQKTVSITRYAILDRQCNIVAYELLFNQPQDSGVSRSNVNSATINLITNAFTNIGIESLLGGKKAYLNFDYELLNSDVMKILPHDKVVLVIPPCRAGVFS